MPDLADHATDRRRVFPDQALAQASEAQSLQCGLLVFGGANAAAVPAQHQSLTLRVLRLHRLSASAGASAARPRRRRISSAFWSRRRPSNVALMTLCGLVVRSDLVRMSAMPTDSRTARTGPPAMTPVPGAAGFRSTRPAP